MEVCKTVQEVVIKTILKKNKCEEAKWFPEEDLKIAEKIREVKGKGKKGKIYPMQCRLSENSKER